MLRTSSNELSPSAILSMTRRRRDSADLLAIRLQNRSETVISLLGHHTIRMKKKG